MPVAEHLKDHYYCILPTSTVYCSGQRYHSKADELLQIENYLKQEGISSLALVVASSLGADLAAAFLSKTQLPVSHVFFDGGQFAKISKGTRRIMAPFLYLAIKSLYWSKGRTLKYLLWCDEDRIKPYFIAAGKALTFGNQHRQMMCSLEEKPFPALSDELQKHTFFEFGSREDHFKYRHAVMKTYPHGQLAVFEEYGKVKSCCKLNNALQPRKRARFHLGN